MRSASPRPRRLRLETLESRETPAGTVTAAMVGTTLTLTGDDDANVVQLSQSAAGIEVLGLNNTTVVGGPTFSGATSVKTLMKDGDDDVRLAITTDFILSGTASFDLGDGDNTLQLLTTGKIGLAGLSVTAGDGKDTVTVAGGFGKGSQVTGNASISLGIGRGDQDNPLGTRTHATVRFVDVLGPAGLKFTALDGDEEFIVQGASVTKAVTATGGEGALDVTTIGGQYGSLVLNSVGYATGNPFRGVNLNLNGTTVTGTVAVTSKLGINVDWTNGTTGPVSVSAGTRGFVVADFHGTSVIHGNLTVRGLRLTVSPEDDSTLTVDGDLSVVGLDSVNLFTSEATLSARNIILTGPNGANFTSFDSDPTTNSIVTVAGAMTLRGKLVQYDQSGGEVTVGTKLSLVGVTEAAFRTGVGFYFNAPPAKTTAASFLIQARTATFNQTESEATFPAGLSVLGSEEAIFETAPREQNEDPNNPGVFDSAAGAKTTVAQGNLLVQSKGFAGYFQAEGVATYAGLSVLGGFATVQTDVGDGFNSVGAKLAVTTRPALVQGSVGEFHQDGGESTFAAGLSILGREGESQFRTDTGETHDPEFTFFDVPAKLTVTTGPLKLDGAGGDVMFSAGGESLNVGGDLSISGVGMNRIWLDPDLGTTVGGNVKVAGATGDPDWFLVWDSLTVAKDLSVNLGGGANAIEFGTDDGTTTIGGKLTLIGGSGSDEITLNAITVQGATAITTGAAADTLTIYGSTFVGTVSVDLGGGADILAIADVPTATAPVTFNSAATVKMGIGNDALRLGLALANGGNANTNVLFGPTGSLNVDGGANLNTFDDEAGQFDIARVTTLNFTDPTP
jgi:hypothetical protein